MIKQLYSWSHLYFLPSLLCIAILAISTQSMAGVSTKNGNFYISYTDIDLSDKAAFNLERTYNSRAMGKGLFGKGWGSDMETRLQITGDGILVIFENGTGRREHFKAGDISREAIEKTVDLIIAAANQDGAFVHESQKQSQRQLLLDSSDMRQSWWKRYAAKGLLKPAHKGVGTIYRVIDNSFDTQQILRTKSGYVRSKDAETDEFDLEGKLLRHTDKRNGQDIRYFWDTAGHIERIEDGKGHIFQVSYNKGNTITSIADKDGTQLVSYHYRSDLLIRSRDMESNVYVYRYGHRYNMTGIGYQDGREMVIAYDHHQLVRFVRKTSGKEVRYSYGNQQSDEGESYHTDTIHMENGRAVVSRQTWQEKTRPDGTRYTYRKGSVLGTIIPDGQGSAGGTTLAERESTYDDQGRVIKNVQGGRVTRLTYNEDGKVTRVLYHPQGSETKRNWISYSYDDQKRVTRIANSIGMAFNMIYNKHGKIRQLSSGNGTLTMDYNVEHRVVRISRQGGGVLNISYDDAGEVDSVEPEKGNGDQLKAIISTLRILSDMADPADIDLGF